jgi:hypothetical protein
MSSRNWPENNDFYQMTMTMFGGLPRKAAWPEPLRSLPGFGFSLGPLWPADRPISNSYS